MTFEKETVLKTLFPEDVLSIAKGLTDGEVEFLQQVDSLLESKYRENINQHWIDATVPEDYFKDLGELNYFNNPLLYKDRPNAKMPSQLFQFFMSYLLARFDISLATLLGVHQGLGHNTFYFGGSKEQIAKYVPKLQSHELRTCFALTEPEHGSDVAGGLETVAERQGDTWVINGEKKWIGGAHVSDVIPVFAVNKDLVHNLDVIFNAQDEAGLFLWETLRNNFYYSAINVPKATDDFRDIDRALVWGFNWKLGPFQLWDAMGYERVKTRMEDEIGDLPQWISDLDGGFYKQDETIEYATPVSHFVKDELWDKGDAKLSVTHDDQLLLKLQSKNNVITDEFNDALVDAIDLLENDHYTSMVIYADGNNFSVGANLFLMKKAHEDGLVYDVVAQSIDKLHYSFNRLKYSLKPVVTAVQGRALGGGCELVLYSPIVVAASETYIGLVEAGVGLLPSGGGLAEMADRILRTSHKFDDKQASMTKVLTNIAFAKVSTNAFEARRYGYLRDTDTIIFNTAQRVEVALKRAKYEAETNYIPNPRHQYIALGEDFKALIQGQLDAQRRGHFISDHDYHIALNIATILAGGDLPRNTFINQRYIQSLEKIGFIDLLKSKKSYERIAHMLKTGKPLRN